MDLGCSKISLSMKWSNPPFSIASRSISSLWMYGVITTSSIVFTLSFPSLITTISWSFRYTTSFVYSMIGVASDAIKYSPLPIPTTNGLPLRAAINCPGFSNDKITIAYAPTTLLSASLTASSSVQLLFCCISSMKWIRTSVSVSLWKWWPFVCNSFFSEA